MPCTGLCKSASLGTQSGGIWALLRADRDTEALEPLKRELTFSENRYGSDALEVAAALKPIGSILYFSEQAALAVPYLRPRVAIERAHYAPARLQKVADAAVALADALAALKTDDEAQKELEALYREAVRISRLVTPRSRP